MRAVMRPVTSTFVQNGRMKPARPNGTKEDGAMGEDGSVINNECTTTAMHAAVQVGQHHRPLIQACQDHLPTPPTDISVGKTMIQ